MPNELLSETSMPNELLPKNCETTPDLLGHLIKIKQAAKHIAFMSDSQCNSTRFRTEQGK